jgi:hypothetical protein
MSYHQGTGFEPDEVKFPSVLDNGTRGATGGDPTQGGIYSMMPGGTADPSRGGIYSRIDANAVPEKAAQMTGSLFINNNSYAGCDIKVCVNLYDTKMEFDDTEAHLKQLLRDLEKNLKTNQGQITKLQKQGLRVKEGTREKEIWWKEYGIALEDQNRIRSDMITLRDRLNTIQQTSIGMRKTPTKVLASCQTLSVSIFRDKQAVRSCGSVYPKAFTRGPREIAGSLIFTVFDEHVLYELLEAHPSDFDSVAYTSALADQLPPFDIIVSFANEYGSLSRMTIYGVEFVNEGGSMGIEDLLTETTISWVARDIDPMRAVGSKVKMDMNSAKLQSDFVTQRASDLLLESDYKNMKFNTSPFDRFYQRRNTFV